MEPQTHLLCSHMPYVFRWRVHSTFALYVLIIILFMFIYVCKSRFKGGTVSDFNWLVKKLTPSPQAKLSGHNLNHLCDVLHLSLKVRGYRKLQIGVVVMKTKCCLCWKLCSSKVENSEEKTRRLRIRSSAEFLYSMTCVVICSHRRSHLSHFYRVSYRYFWRRDS